MNSRGRILVRILLGASAVFAVTAIAFQVERMRQPPLGEFKPVPDFQLIERSGKTISLADLKGKVWLADFIYSTCPGPCPMITSHLADLQNEALKNPDVRFVSVSTNPDNDTPDVLQKYAGRFGASSQWLFLTGEKDKVYDLIQKGFSLAVAEQADEKNPIVHSTKIVLVDKKGVVRKYYDGEDTTQNADILHDIGRLAKEK